MVSKKIIQQNGLRVKSVNGAFIVDNARATDGFRDICSLSQRLNINIEPDFPDKLVQHCGFTDRDWNEAVS